jgi:proton-translocating NADH-quinone oxidoreductase chain N
MIFILKEYYYNLFRDDFLLGLLYSLEYFLWEKGFFITFQASKVFMVFLEWEHEYFYNYIAIYVELFFIVCSSLVIFFFVIFDYIFKYKFILSLNIGYVFILIFILMYLLLNGVKSSFFIFDDILREDSFSIFIQNILIINFIFYIIISLDYIFLEKIVHYEYFLLVALSFIGMIIMVKSNDLISLYLAIELQSLVFYIISSFKVFSNFSTEAGLKYFILGSFSSGILLLGCSLIYGFVGTTNFSDLRLLGGIQIWNNSSIGILVGIIFILIGLLFKLGAAPFHMWLPDVYQGVPTSVTALFAIIPKIAIFGLLYRLGNSFCGDSFFFWNQLFLSVALMSIILGTFGALYQSKIKKLLAYSAISHTGFLLLGYSSFTNYSLFATYLYIIVYIIISLNIFILLLVLRRRDNFLKFKNLSEFVVLFKSNPLLSINFCLILFSIAGIPPLLGFYSKLFIFLSVLNFDLYFIVFLVAVTSVVASMYYIRLIKLMFFKKFRFWSFLFEISKYNCILLSVTFVLNVIFSLYPEKFLIFVYNILI